MVIQILGSGCPKCKALESNTREAILVSGIDATIEKITEIDKFLEMGVMMTPALAIDGDVKSVGTVLTKDQILSFMKHTM